MALKFNHTPFAVKANRSATLFSDDLEDDSKHLNWVRPTQAYRKTLLGQLEVTPSNFPRLDYTHNECPELLLEPESTNLIIHNTRLTDNHTKGGTNNNPTNITFSNETSPVGSTAVKVANYQANTSITYTQFGANPLGTVVSFSALVKGTAGETCTMGVNNIDRLHTFSGDWEYVKHENIVTTNKVVGFTNNNATKDKDGNTLSTPIASTAQVFLVGYIQVETLEYCTSLIKTQDYIETRSEDNQVRTVYNNAITDVLVNNSGFELKVRALTNGKSKRVISLHGNNVLNHKNAIEFVYSEIPNKIEIRLLDDSNDVLSYTELYGDIDQTDVNTFFITTTGTQLIVKVNGIERLRKDYTIDQTLKLESITFDQPPTSGSVGGPEIPIGGSIGTNPFYGWVSFVKVYDDTADRLNQFTAFSNYALQTKFNIR